MDRLIAPILALTLIAAPARADDLNMVRGYVAWFFRGVDPRRAEEAQKLAPIVVEQAGKYRIHPLRVAVTISFESSWRPRVVGALGERGLMQCHGVHARGFDLSTAEGQIACGAAHLRASLDLCGDWRGALTHYQTGRRCAPALRAAFWRDRAYWAAMKLVAKGD